MDDAVVSDGGVTVGTRTEESGLDITVGSADGITLGDDMGEADDAVVGGNTGVGILDVGGMAAGIILGVDMGEAVVGGNTGVDILDVGGTAAGGVLDSCAAVVPGEFTETTAAGDVVDTTGISPAKALVVAPL